MRIVYVGDTLVPASGVSQKMLAQAGEWERHGHLVWLATAAAPVPERVEVVRDRLARAAAASVPGGTARRRLLDRVLLRAANLRALDRTARALDAELIYTRELPLSLGLGRLLERTPAVVELTSDTVQEAPRRLTREERRLRRRRMLARARGVVCVSEEIRRACAPGAAPCVVIANACEPTPDGRAVERARPERPTLVYIGSRNHPWGGVDKLARLAERLPQFDFIAIGVDAAPRPNLRVLPPMPRAEADRVIARATVGVGPLALHRKGMDEASPLKTRQYLALGLPIIQAYRDTDLAPDLACVLELPNREDNCEQSVERIRRFVGEAYANEALSAQALALARGPLSLQAKEALRLAFFDRVLGGSP